MQIKRARLFDVRDAAVFSEQFGNQRGNLVSLGLDGHLHRIALGGASGVLVFRECSLVLGLCQLEAQAERLVVERLLLCDEGADEFMQLSPSKRGRSHGFVR